MDFNADIRITIRMPFSFDVETLVEPERVPVKFDDQIRYKIADLEGYHDSLNRVEEQRINAAKYAETTVLDKLRAAVNELGGEIIFEVVEGVSER